jgi:hypothetical protein
MLISLGPVPHVLYFKLELDHLLIVVSVLYSLDIFIRPGASLILFEECM